MNDQYLVERGIAVKDGPILYVSEPEFSTLVLREYERWFGVATVELFDDTSDLGSSLSSLAERFGVSPKVLRRWKHYYDIFVMSGGRVEDLKPAQWVDPWEEPDSNPFWERIDADDLSIFNGQAGQALLNFF